MPTRSTPAQLAAKYRTALLELGIKPVQVWLPDSRDPDFAEKIARPATDSGTDADSAECYDPDLDAIEEMAVQDAFEELEALERSSSK